MGEIEQSKRPAVIPVLLSGGMGTRLWPMSREHFPKQLQPMAGRLSMLQETARRFACRARFAPPLIVTNEALRFAVAEQMRQLGMAPQGLLLEPAARGTAPAAAAAALFALRRDPEAVLLVAPADHLIRRRDRFLDLVQAACASARDGHLATFAVQPTRPETGYGYIRPGPRLDGGDTLFHVAEFIEKPDAARAAALVSQGEYFWNSGIFLFSARHFLTELGEWAPDVLTAAERAVAGGVADHDFFRLEATAFAASPAISIDHAVMEHTRRAVTIPCDVGWSDLGAWDEVWNIADKDAAGCVLTGDVVAENARDCYVHSDGMLTAVVGVDNLVVVVTDDAVLVTDRDHAQQVKTVTDRLRAAGRRELTNHSRVSRPWGFYQSVLDGDRFQVKRLTVNPSARLSLQRHLHRAEHWVVVHGTALVTRDDDVRLLHENQSTYIPPGSVHRLENPGKVPLHLIEIQTGSYLGEDDIVRFEDSYGRT